MQWTDLDWQDQSTICVHVNFVSLSKNVEIEKFKISRWIPLSQDWWTSIPKCWVSKMLWNWQWMELAMVEKWNYSIVWIILLVTTVVVIICFLFYIAADNNMLRDCWPSHPTCLLTCRFWWHVRHLMWDISICWFMMNEHLLPFSCS